MYFNDPWSLFEHGVSLPSIITIFLLYQLLWLADDIIASWWTQGQHPHSQFVNLFLLYNHLRSEEKSPDITWQTLCECFRKPWTVSCLPSHSFSLSLPRLLFEFHLCPCVFSWLNSPLIILDIDFPLPIDLCHGLSDTLSTNFPFIFPATPSLITSTLWAWQLIQSSFRPPHYSLSIDASPRCSY